MTRVFPVKRIAMVFGSLLFIALILESFIRVVAPQRVLKTVESMSLHCYQKSNILTFEYIPFCRDEVLSSTGRSIAVSFNAYGLRGKQIGEKKGKRILLLGDSFVFGEGVDISETLGTSLEEKLGSEVIAAGFLGSGPDTLYVYAAQKGVVLEPDMMIVTLFPANDLTDLGATIWKEQDGAPVSVKDYDKWVDEKGYFRGSITGWNYRIPVLRNSHLFQFTASRLSALASRVRLLGHEATHAGFPGRSERSAYEGCIKDKGCIHDWEVARQRLYRILGLFQELTVREGIPLVVVLIPSESQVLGRYPAETSFHEFLRDTTIPFLDLRSILKESEREGELYLPDGHFTPLGNRVAARAIADWLEDKRL